VRQGPQRRVLFPKHQPQQPAAMVLIQMHSQLSCLRTHLSPVIDLRVVAMPPTTCYLQLCNGVGGWPLGQAGTWASLLKANPGTWAPCEHRHVRRVRVLGGTSVGIPASRRRMSAAALQVHDLGQLWLHGVADVPAAWARFSRGHVLPKGGGW
jgi:hypothetical protein